MPVSPAKRRWRSSGMSPPNESPDLSAGPRATAPLPPTHTRTHTHINVQSRGAVGNESKRHLRCRISTWVGSIKLLKLFLPLQMRLDLCLLQFVQLMHTPTTMT